MFYAPGRGFVFICLTYTFVLSFFTWGFSMPDLDRVWILYHELQIGKINKLSDMERIVLSKSTARYPGLTRELLNSSDIGLISANNEGWSNNSTAIILRSPKSEYCTTLNIKIPKFKDFSSYNIELKGNGGIDNKWLWKKRLNLSEVMKIALPPPPGTPEIIEISINSSSLMSKFSDVRIYIGFLKKNQNAVHGGEV